GLGAALALSVCVDVFAIERCDNGVNFSNGNTTKGLTALVTCVDDESKLTTRRMPLVNGLVDGVEERFDKRTGKKISETAHKAGKREGWLRKYDASTGQLESEETLHNDSFEGLARRFWPNGTLRSESYVSDERAMHASIRYREDGSIEAFECASKPLLSRDAELCGFNGKPSQVQMGTRGASDIRSYLNGKREGRWQQRSPDGTLLREIVYVGGEQRETLVRLTDGGTRRALYENPSTYTVTQAFPDGRPANEEKVQANKLISFRAAWQNGQPRAKWTMQPAGTPAQGGSASATASATSATASSMPAVATAASAQGVSTQALWSIENFHDNGKLAERFTSPDSPRRYGDTLSAPTPEGRFETFTPEGKPERAGIVQAGRGQRFGAFTGEAFTYYANGQTASKATYDNDRVVRLIRFDEQGVQTADESFFPDG
ncbi:MAG: hypothetical protein JWP52_765, partial [Rhizobacter sp.]|nr:hypothetical protein [Rhizobacter sp.]